MFNVGDIVTLRGCSGLMEVLSVNPHSQTVLTNYCSSIRAGYNDRARRYPFDRLELHIPKEEPMAQLFETPDGKFGTELAKNSQGQMVLEIKGTGEVKAYDPKTLKEVVPYTVAIKTENQSQFHIEAREDQFKKGDYVLVNFTVGIVTDLDTKCRSPRKQKNLRKLITEEIS